MSRSYKPPSQHPSGAKPPKLPGEAIPNHVAIIMDGNGRWAKARGLPRTEGHRMGEAALFDVIEGAIELGVKYLSAYAFSTENWRRSPEVVDAVAAMAEDVQAGKLRPDKITEKTIHRYLYCPDVPDVDLVLRSSGEQRLSNYLIWQAAYAEFVSLDTLWPDFDRRHFWYGCELYAQRDRRFGGAIPNPVAPPPSGHR